MVACAERFKGDGNAKFGAKKFKEAEGHYRDALSHAETVKNDNPALIKLKVIILQNMSNCLLQTADLKEAVAMTSKAIELDSKAWKALFFRSQA